MKDTEANIETVTCALTAIVEGKLDDLRAQLDADPKWNVTTFLPEAGLHEGADAMVNMLGVRRERFAGGYAFKHLTVHGTHDHVFAEYTRTGATDVEGEHCMAVFELVMGKIREIREFAFRT